MKKLINRLRFSGSRFKNTPVLIRAVYQPSSNETEKLIWLEKFERILTEIYIKSSGVIIIAGDFNIDLLNGNKQSQRRYKDMLHSFSLRQHITKATRKLKTLIDHVISTIPNGVIHHDIVHTEEISDRDVLYVIFNIKKVKYQPRYKFIRNEKTLDMNSYTSDFQQLPLNLVYSFDDPKDQVSIFNKLVVDCINTHAPLRKVKFTRPVAPWMNDPKIANLQKDLDTQHTIYRNHKSSNNHTNYQNTRNKLKKSIKDTFKINHTNYDEIRKILLRIKNDCSTGHDGIPIRYLKPVADDITSPSLHQHMHRQ